MKIVLVNLNGAKPMYYVRQIRKMVTTPFANKAFGFQCEADARKLKQVLPKDFADFEVKFLDL